MKAGQCCAGTTSDQVEPRDDAAMANGVAASLKLDLDVIQAAILEYKGDIDSALEVPLPVSCDLATQCNDEACAVASWLHEQARAQVHHSSDVMLPCYFLCNGPCFGVSLGLAQVTFSSVLATMLQAVQQNYLQPEEHLFEQDFQSAQSMASSNSASGDPSCT